LFSGRAVGVIVETGLKTELGKIASAISNVETAKAPLMIRMEKFSKHISIIVIIACIFLNYY
jgi:magnesium-transporting ATPase (P-type)